MGSRLQEHMFVSTQAMRSFTSCFGHSLVSQCLIRPRVARGFRRSGGRAVLHQCIRLLIAAYCAPSNGCQRAYDLIAREASNGPFGSPVFACASGSRLMQGVAVLGEGF
jgi:hypothetical protein